MGHLGIRGSIILVNLAIVMLSILPIVSGGLQIDLPQPCGGPQPQMPVVLRQGERIGIWFSPKARGVHEKR